MDVPAPVREVPTVRLCGGAAAVAAGSYAVWLGVDTAGAVGADVLVALGSAAALHGLLLLSGVLSAVGRINGLAMLAYAGAFFVLLGWREVVAEAALPAEVLPGIDPGLVALASLVLVSGAVVAARYEPTD